MARKHEDARTERAATSKRTGVPALRNGAEEAASKTSARVIAATHRRRRKAMKELADR
ncbi:hypothetical protein [Rhodosalinus sediminis]|uniref:hypothetical protein n=1 Tax=Rhodosalinus sediminis TaxID=1940533 RepID=UPI0023524EF0|nr:hypothetical protein [Rhodosalinus sediminis]